MTDQPTAKPGDLIYEDTGANAPLVYFDIVGAYGTMNGSVEIELATRILVPKSDGSTEVARVTGGAALLPEDGARVLRGAAAEGAERSPLRAGAEVAP